MTSFAAETPTIETLVPFWTEVFGVPAEVFTQVWNAVPTERRGTFVRYEDNEMAATVQVYVLPFNGYEVGCIANVATRESSRKRGYSTELLQEAIEWMGRRGVQFSLLFTGVPHHYAKLGWASVQGSLYKVVSDAEPISPNSVDLDLLKRLHAAYLPTFALRRDEQWWNQAIAPRIANRLTWSTPDAYLIASNDNGLLIEEAFGEEEAVRALVLGATAWAGGQSTYCGSLPIGEHGPRDGGMLRGGALPQGAWYSPLDYF